MKSNRGDWNISSQNGLHFGILVISHF